MNAGRVTLALDELWRTLTDEQATQIRAALPVGVRDRAGAPQEVRIVTADRTDADLRQAVEERLAARLAEARRRRVARERARAEKQERRDAGLRARHAAKLHRTENQK